jgi:hypothetical protein
MNTRRSFLLALALVSVSSACGGTGGGGGGGGSGSGDTASIILTNSGSTTIYYFYISPSAVSDWGSDQLGSAVVESGHSFRVNGVPCGENMDFKAEDSNHAVLGTLFSQFVTCGDAFAVTVH